MSAKSVILISILLVSLIILVLVIAYGKQVASIFRPYKFSETERFEKIETAKVSTVTINGAKIEVELADTSAKRMKGLSGRQSLAPDKGLLFLFNRPGIYSFWMKDMNFPIDIIWIGPDYRIVDITYNLTPDTFPKSFRPQMPAKFVLEVNAGFARERGIKIGDKIELLR